MMNLLARNWFFVTIDSIVSNCFSDVARVSTLLGRISIEEDSLGFVECGDFFLPCALVRVSTLLGRISIKEDSSDLSGERI